MWECMGSMTTGEQIVEQARTWIGTPFYHAGREKGLGVDCIGLVIGVCNELGLIGGYDNREYSQVAPDGTMRREVSRFFDELLPGAPMAPGDVLLFTIGGLEQHIAIYTGPGEQRIIHAFQSVGVVAEHDFKGVWVRACTGFFRLRGA
jgi:cell wall-associated NlpC family hydrolase